MSSLFSHSKLKKFPTSFVLKKLQLIFLPLIWICSDLSDLDLIRICSIKLHLMLPRLRTSVTTLTKT